jgi:Uma2 family endonuclease
MSSVQKILPHYTYEDWLHWEGSWELMDGFPIAMSPKPQPKHQMVASALNAEFVFLLKKCKKCRVFEPLDYKIADDTILVPDVLIVCGKINKSYLDFPPTLVVEILSPSTALRDRHTKYNYYEQQGIKYYLIVDADKQLVEIYEWKDGSYSLQPFLQEQQFNFVFEEGCGGVIDFKEIWAY